MAYFPMMIDLEGTDVMVVGAGKEADKKVEVLAQFGPYITLIAPMAEPKILPLVKEYICREFADGDITGSEKKYAMVVAATDDRKVNERISRLAGERHIPVNIVDDTELCSFIFPAIHKDKDVVCAVSSGGKGPVITQYIRNRLREVLPENIGEINERMGELRLTAKQKFPELAQRRQYLQMCLEQMLAGDETEEKDNDSQTKR